MSNPSPRAPTVRDSMLRFRVLDEHLEPGTSGESRHVRVRSGMVTVGRVLQESRFEPPRLARFRRVQGFCRTTPGDPPDFKLAG